VYPAGVGSPVPAVLKTLSPSLANLDISLGSIPAGSIGSPALANLPTTSESMSIARGRFPASANLAASLGSSA